MVWYIAGGVLCWWPEDHYVDWDGATSTFGTFRTPVPSGDPFLPLRLDDPTELDAAVEICSAEFWEFQSRPRHGGGTVCLHASRLAKLRAFLARPRPADVKPYEASIPLPVERPTPPPESPYDPLLDEPRHESGPPFPDGGTSVTGRPITSLRDYWRA